MKRMKLMLVIFSMLGVMSVSGCNANAVATGGGTGSIGGEVGICLVGVISPCNGNI